MAANPSAVVFETTMGAIQFELYWDHAPKTCQNFSELAKRGYYNGTIFHRVVADFMAQGGDPTGTGRGGRSIFGDKFEDEIAPTPHLDRKHTIFGRVHEGMKVLERIGSVNVDSEDRPREPVKILKARVVDPLS